MTLVRCVHNKNYSVINNTILSDHRLSFKAKGLWTYCMSRPDNWEFHVNHLATVSTEGKDAVYSAIGELIAAGYCEKKSIKGADGRFYGVEYVFYESPIELKENLPHRDFPDVENPPLINTDSKSSTERRSSSEEEDPVLNSKVGIKGKMRKIFIDYSDEDFNTAWDRYMSQTDSKIIFSPRKYLEKILEGIKIDTIRGINKEELIKRHEKQASENEVFNSSYQIQACNGYVEFSSGCHCRRIPYDCSDAEWEQHTGWPSNG